MDIRTIFLLLATLVALVICTEDESKISKRDTSEEEESNIVPEELDEADKRAAKIFRYGRGASIFRYGKRAPVFRYGKRGATIFRYGKRSDDVLDDIYDDEVYAETPAQWKRLFRWGKRDGGEDIKRIFRWGKRSDEDEEEEEKRSRIFRYGRSGPAARDVRTPNQPHVPFRFGDRE